ncbi:MAG: Soluble attachment protein [Acidobacteriota bacterium]|jgi:tetratricopeptide (TPR) repeat protein|nr:Soluble attachment protein [Acidobacteriota bacterium]
MADIHLTRDLLWAVIRGELPASVITRIGTQHLMSLCATCRQEITAFQKERAAPPAADYDRAFHLLPAVLAEQVPRLEREQRGAARDLEELLTLSREERVRRVERARNRFRSAALVRLLVGESRKRVQADPDEALHLARLGRLVAHCNPQMPGAFDLIALATAQMANACRMLDDTRQAEEHFGHARYVITHHGVTDTEILARVDKLEGSLCMDQRLFPQAEELLARAATLFRVSGDPVETARVLVTLGSLYFFQDDRERAIETTTAALKGMRADREPRLYLCARYNLARYLTEDGQYDEAADILSVDEDLYREFPEAWTQLRLTWLRGKIAAGRGESDAAEKAFLEVRDGFIAAGIGYDAAMVAIEDLALLYLREGRTADVKRLAEEILPIFQSQDVHREALAALRLFQEAARQEQLTVQVVRDYVRYLREARTDPALPFQPAQPS